MFQSPPTRFFLWSLSFWGLHHLSESIIPGSLGASSLVPVSCLRNQPKKLLFLICYWNPPNHVVYNYDLILSIYIYYILYICIWQDILYIYIYIHRHHVSRQPQPPVLPRCLAIHRKRASEARFALVHLWNCWRMCIWYILNVYTYIYICAYIYIYMYVYVYTCVYMYVHISLHTYMYIYINICIYIYTYINTHVYL